MSFSPPPPQFPKYSIWFEALFSLSHFLLLSFFFFYLFVFYF